MLWLSLLHVHSAEELDMHTQLCSCTRYAYTCTRTHIHSHTRRQMWALDKLRHSRSASFSYFFLPLAAMSSQALRLALLISSNRSAMSPVGLSSSLTRFYNSTVEVWSTLTVSVMPCMYGGSHALFGYLSGSQASTMTAVVRCGLC